VTTPAVHQQPHRPNPIPLSLRKLTARSVSIHAMKDDQRRLGRGAIVLLVGVSVAVLRDFPFLLIKRLAVQARDHFQRACSCSGSRDRYPDGSLGPSSHLVRWSRTVVFAVTSETSAWLLTHFNFRMVDSFAVSTDTGLFSAHNVRMARQNAIQTISSG
jgi:hypothetical protein